MSRIFSFHVRTSFGPERGTGIGPGRDVFLHLSCHRSLPRTQEFRTASSGRPDRAGRPACIAHLGSARFSGRRSSSLVGGPSIARTSFSLLPASVTAGASDDGRVGEADAVSVAGADASGRRRRRAGGRTWPRGRRRARPSSVARSRLRRCQPCEVVSHVSRRLTARQEQ